MQDDPNDTLTTIEAKVLCMRYGIEDIDASSSIKRLREYQQQEHTGRSLSAVAKKLGADKNSLKATEINALRKLKITESGSN